MATQKVTIIPQTTKTVKPVKFFIDAEAKIIQVVFRDTGDGSENSYTYTNDDAGTNNFAAILAQFPQLAQLRALAIDIADFMGDEDKADWT